MYKNAAQACLPIIMDSMAAREEPAMPKQGTDLIHIVTLITKVPVIFFQF